MTSSSLAYSGRQARALARFGDYFELTKPKIAALVLLTVAVAACAAAGGALNSIALAHTLIGTALVAASASALNQWLERETDALMRRTASRPLPAGRVGSAEVLILAGLAAAVGGLWLAVLVNPLTAALALATWTLYVWVYTPLKTRTWLNTAVGAVPGAMPILIGWSSAGPLDARAAALFGIVYLWQFPHFMSIAWRYRREYERAGLQMLPVVDGSGRRTGFQAAAGAAALIPAGVLAAWLLGAGPAWSVAAALLAVLQTAVAWQFARRLDETSARRLLRASLIYLPAVLMLLLTGSCLK